MRRTAAICLCCIALLHPASRAAESLPGTGPLELPENPSAAMVAGIDRFLMRELEAAPSRRKERWSLNAASAESFRKATDPKRERLRHIIGAVDPRLKVEALEYLGNTLDPAQVAETGTLRISSVRWAVFEGVHGEGLLLEPRGPIRARVVAIPDADQTPEMISGLQPGVEPLSQFARRLAESGCQVLVPMLIDRKDTGSGNARLNRFTNQPHREWIYRQAFQMGRHLVGYEVQKVMAALDWMAAQNPDGSRVRLGVMGYGEGGLIALHTAALDARVEAVAVSGYFESRQKVWAEPIYRNIFGFLREFGDAELAVLCAPRRVLVEHSAVAEITGPPKSRPGRGGAAPGRITSPEYASVSDEVLRATRMLTADWAKDWIEVINGSEGIVVSPGSEKTLVRFLNALGVANPGLNAPGTIPVDGRRSFSPEQRQLRQVDELVQHTQRLLRQSESVRDGFLFRKVKHSESGRWADDRKAWQTQLWDDVIGRFPAATLPIQPRSRLTHDQEKWKGYDVMLDVWPDVFAWGVLLVPTDLRPGERRPVVVCQHGLEGVPFDTLTQDPKAGGHQYYKGFASKLAERGFIVFSPHNPYRGEDRFRVLQRKANPLGCSLFSVIIAQHDRILDWLSGLSFVDPERIGFYGLSYGGKTAMRVPAVLDRYCLSICSADYNEWITKNATTDSGYSYLFTGEYEMPEFNLGNTFNYAEMAALIAPRPFMVERGHDDGVAPDEWVAHEFARVRRFYTKMGWGDRTEMEVFNGPHTINGQGTYRFLHRHLHWPEPAAAR